MRMTHFKRHLSWMLLSQPSVCPVEAMGFMTDFNSPTGWEQGGGS